MALGAGYDNLLEDQYRVPLLAKILHALPHLNITFHRTNNTFRPTDEIYLEVSQWRRWKIDRIIFLQNLQSLGILGSIPAAALIISLFCLLLYLMSRCCDRKPRPAHSITSLKVTLSIVTVLCCAAIGLGEWNFLGNPFFIFQFISLAPYFGLNFIIRSPMTAWTVSMTFSLFYCLIKLFSLPVKSARVIFAHHCVF